MSTPICVAFPTIMSGLVLRWYADEQAYSDNREWANAGRECFMTFEGCPDDVRKLADQAHAYLTVEYAAHFHPRLDVSRWVTHHAQLTVPIGTDELIPVGARSDQGRYRGSSE